MNNIQKLIELSEAEKSKTLDSILLLCKSGKYDDMVNSARMVAVFDLFIQALNLFFNKHTGAITESAHFANTMLSEVCRKEETSNSGVIPAGSSETWLVEQNLDKLKPEE